MTVIAYRDGVLAADSRTTTESEAGGIRHFKCQKLFRKKGSIIATAGENGPGLAFIRWYGSGRPFPEVFAIGEADFSCLVLTAKGLFEYDKWGVAEKITLPKTAPFYAIGCGAKAALGAMHMGASARKACAVACRVDPLCDFPIVSMSL